MDSHANKRLVYPIWALFPYAPSSMEKDEEIGNISLRTIFKMKKMDGKRRLEKSVQDCKMTMLIKRVSDVLGIKNPIFW